MVLVLAETAAGYAVFKVKDKALKKSKSHADDLNSIENATQSIRLKTFEKFENTADALDNIAAIVEGKVSPKLASLLKGLEDKSSSLIVSDPKLGTSISQIPELSFEIVADSSTVDVYRAIRTHISVLIPELLPKELQQMSLGLSHSLSRHKLKFSPDKIDTMIVQAIGLLDDLDKELNTYVMRVKEWYGWHFPEMGKIVTENLAYAKVIQEMGFRTNAADTDFSDILPEDVSTSLKATAEVSMGTEISQTDLDNILRLVEQIVSLSDYRKQLYNYLCARMRAIAPNLTTLVGELVGARLISHAGNLVNLAKQPASTIQILGAEKALFRALKTKKDTPKYGLIFHASLVGQAPLKHKGKIARTLAAKAALALRYDALVGITTRSGDSANVEMDEVEITDGPTVGIQYRQKVEQRLAMLENQVDGITPKRNSVKHPKFEFKAVPAYNVDADVPMTEAELSPLLSTGNKEEKEKKKDKDKKEKKDKDEKKAKKDKKRSREELEEDEDEIEEAVVAQSKSNGVQESEATKKSKKDKKDPEAKQKKRKIAEAEEAAEAAEDGLDEKARRKLEKKMAKQERREAKKARKA